MTTVLETLKSVVRLTDCTFLNMTIAVDWDVKPQTNSAC